MTILITSGFEKSWCEFAQTRLTSMGVASSEKSKRNDIEALTFLNKMCVSYKLSVDRSRSFRQIDPGKAWQITAADLVVGNSGIENWGWADPRNLFFLEFWKEFDEACKFLLIYGPLHESIAHHIEKKGSFPKSADAWVSRWTSYHAEMLKFYHSNPDRCLLIHISELSGGANELSRQLQSALNIPARLLNSEEYLLQDSISTLAANQILQGSAFEDSGHIGLYRELENAANLPDSQAGNTSQLAQEALKDYQASQQKNKRLSRKLETQDKIAGGLADELVFANQTLSTKNVEINDLQKIVSKRDGVIKSLKLDHEKSLLEKAAVQSNKITELKSQIKKLSGKEHENELLLLQLHQVQEELEHYFSKFQQLKAPKKKKRVSANSDNIVSNVPIIKPLKPSKTQEHVLIEFNSFVDGTGWHSPEGFGRWAGVSSQSTINIPSLKPGKYVLNAKIIDGMDSSILKGLQLFFDEEKLNISRKLMSSLTGPLTPIRRLRAKIGQIEKPYPVEIKSVFTISGKAGRGKSHLLSLKVPNTISPSELGEHDTRNLSLCYQSLEIIKL